MKRDINTLSLLNEISELVYVSDPETYELLFVNQTGCQTLHLENYKHKNFTLRILYQRQTVR